MTSQNETWESLKTEYLHQIEKALSSVNHARSKDILADVSSHLDQRFTELPPEKHTWESFQAIITDMGPPSEYAELLNTGQPLNKQRPSPKFVVFGLVILGIVAAVIIILSTLYQSDQDSPTISQPEPNAFEIQHRKDTLPHPFVNDPRVLGSWESVDFVWRVSDFEPGIKKWSKELFLKNLKFMKNGRTSLPALNWTKGWILNEHMTWNRRMTMKAQYKIKVIDGEPYLFFPWIAGANRDKPPYYVLKKVPAREAAINDSLDINARIAQLDIDTATLDDVIRIFGEPEKYLWDKDTFTKDNLPSIFIAAYYSDGLRVVISSGKIYELRFAGPEIGYVYKGKLQLGSSLDEALEVLGEPSRTVVGQQIGQEDGVLYKDINGHKGRCYYMRGDQNIYLSFRDYRIYRIFITHSSEE